MSQDTTGSSQAYLTKTRLGFGLAGNAPIDTIEAAAEAAERTGYDSFWLSNPPGSTLAEIAAALRVTHSIRVGVGVIPLSHHTPDDIVGEIDHNRLPLDRFVLGIGSGNADRPLALVRNAMQAIRAQVEATIYLAALGEKMCRLAGDGADGVIFNWLTPDYARPSVEWVRQGAAQAGRAMPELVAYQRVAVGEPSQERLQREAARYTAIPHYAAHFDRMGLSAVDTAISAPDAQQLRRSLARWDGIVDEVVVRALPANDTIDETLAILEAAAPGT